MVVQVNTLDCQADELRCENCDDMLALAAAVESRSEHPLAHAIRERAGAALPEPEGFEAVTGAGVSATALRTCS